MRSFEDLVMRESLAAELQRRRRTLLLVAWPVTLAVPILCLVAYYTRPVEAYTAVAMVVISLTLFALLASTLRVSNAQLYRMAIAWVLALMAFVLLQTANVLFGSTEPLYLQGRPPLLIVSYVLIVVLAFTIVEHRWARLLTWSYAAIFFLLVAAHAIWRLDAFESRYAQVMMLTAAIVGVPGAIILMRIYFTVHVNAVHAASIKMQEQLVEQSLSNRDGVTGALSREGMEAQLLRRLNSRVAFGLVAVKLTSQDEVQEQLGVARYESLLQEIVLTIKSVAGDGTSIARRESSEIVLWSDSLAEQSHLTQFATELLGALSAANLPGRDLAGLQFRAATLQSQEFGDPVLLIDELLFRLFLAKSRKTALCLGHEDGMAEA